MSIGLLTVASSSAARSFAAHRRFHQVFPQLFSSLLAEHGAPLLIRVDCCCNFISPVTHARARLRIINFAMTKTRLRRCNPSRGHNVGSAHSAIPLRVSIAALFRDLRLSAPPSPKFHSDCDYTVNVYVQPPFLGIIPANSGPGLLECCRWRGNILEVMENIGERCSHDCQSI